MSRARDLANLGASADAGGLTGPNLIINGAMTIDQRNSGSSVTPSNSYTLDRFSTNTSQASKFTVQQDTTAPVNFVNSLKVTSSSAYTVGSGDVFTVYQNIEGQNISHLNWGSANAQTVTLSFKVRSSLTGTFGGAIVNSAQNRSYPFTYTISTANTWTDIAITVAGDTSGTWLTTNGIGIRVRFGLGAGSTYSGTAGAWAGANYFSATGAVDVVATSGATWYITGVQLEVGETATPFEHEDFGTTLRKCQRYFQAFKTGRVNTSLVSIASSTSQAIINMPLQVEPRALASYDGALASGTFTKTGTVAVNAFPSNGDNVTGIPFWVCNSTEITVGLNTSATLVQYNGYSTRIGGSAGQTVFTLDVEL